MGKVEIPILSYTEIRRKADEFREKFWGKKQMPLDIELIVERDLDIIIDIRRDLNALFDIRGYINILENKILVDEYFFESNEELSRFTIAHEIGHMILHSGIYKIANVSTLEKYNEFRNSITEVEYSRLEGQANIFAGCLLVPTQILVAEYNKILKERGDMSKMAIIFKVSKRTLVYRIKKEILDK